MLQNPAMIIADWLNKRTDLITVEPSREAIQAKPIARELGSVTGLNILQENVWLITPPFC
jgi:hypothetical protein